MTDNAVLFYSFSKFTLGHSARASILAATIARSGVSAILIHDQAAFTVPSCVTSILMPNWRLGPEFRSTRKPGAADMLPPVGGTATSLSEARAAVFLEAIERYQPQTLYLDHFPFSTRPFEREVLPALDLARKSGARIICGFRGVLSSADGSDQSHQQKIVDLLRRYVDVVLIFLPVEFATLVPAFLLNASVQIRFAGFLAPELGAPPNEVEPTDVIASMGGGVDAAKQVNCIIECARETPELSYRLSVGPNFAGLDETLRSNLPSNLRIASFIDDLPAKIRCSKVYIGMSGYNTAMAVMAANKRCVLLPRVGDESAEQHIWATLMQHLGFAGAVFGGPTYCAKEIGKAIRHAAADDRGGALFSPIAMTGVQGAVDEILARR